LLGDVKVKLILKNEKVRRRPSCIGKNVECLVVSLGCLDWIWQEAASTCYQERAFRIGRGSPTAPFSSKHSIQLLRATELEVVVPETATCILQDSNHQEPYSSELPWSYRMPLHQEKRASKAWDLPRDGLQCATCRVIMKYARGYLTVVRILCYRKLANKLSGKEQLYTGRQWILEFESLLAIFDS
jgi:hypothetical protein